MSKSLRLVTVVLGTSCLVKIIPDDDASGVRALISVSSVLGSCSVVFLEHDDLLLVLSAVVAKLFSDECFSDPTEDAISPLFVLSCNPLRVVFWLSFFAGSLQVLFSSPFFCSALATPLLSISISDRRDGEREFPAKIVQCWCSRRGTATNGALATTDENDDRNPDAIPSSFVSAAAAAVAAVWKIASLGKALRCKVVTSVLTVFLGDLLRPPPRPPRFGDTLRPPFRPFGDLFLFSSLFVSMPFLSSDLGSTQTEREKSSSSKEARKIQS